MYEEKYRPFVVTAITGCVLWTFSGGLIHAYVICPDWEQLGPTAIEGLAGIRPLLALVATALIVGLAIEVSTKFLGAVLRSEGAVMLAPIVVGASIGALQGTIVPTELWSFAAALIVNPLDGLNIRPLTINCAAFAATSNWVKVSIMMKFIILCAGAFLLIILGLLAGVEALALRSAARKYWAKTVVFRMLILSFVIGLISISLLASGTYLFILAYRALPPAKSLL